MAIATTTSRSNVEALFSSLFGADWRKRFAAVVCAEDAPDKKPDPQAYHLVLQRLGVAPDEAFALEDSPNGLRAALAAGIPCGITRSAYFADAVFDGADWVRDDLERPQPLSLCPALRRPPAATSAIRSGRRIPASPRWPTCPSCRPTRRTWRGRPCR